MFTVKHLIAAIAIVAIAMAFRSYSHNSKPAESSATSDYEGYYEYLPPLKGHAAIKDGRFIWVFGQSDGTGSIRGEAGTYTVLNDIVTVSIKYSSNPASVGNGFRFRLGQFSGDTATNEIINSEGQLIGTVRAIRVSK